MRVVCVGYTGVACVRCGRCIVRACGMLGVSVMWYVCCVSYGMCGLYDVCFMWYVQCVCHVVCVLCVMWCVYGSESFVQSANRSNAICPEDICLFFPVKAATLLQPNACRKISDGQISANRTIPGTSFQL